MLEWFINTELIYKSGPFINVFVVYKYMNDL